MTTNLDPASLEAAQTGTRDQTFSALTIDEHRQLIRDAITTYLDTLSHAGEGEPSAEQINQFQFLRSLQVGIFTCIGLDSEKLRHAKELRKRGYVTIADSANGPMVNLTEEGAVASLDWPAFYASRIRELEAGLQTILDRPRDADSSWATIHAEVMSEIRALKETDNG